MSGREAKAALRARMRASRAAIPAAERAVLGARVADALLGVPEVAAARSVLLFYSFGTEIPTREIARRLLGAGRRLLLPYLAPHGVMEAAEVRNGDELVETAYGPREPARREPVDPGEIDVIVTPGLAFDRRGRRLGYGAAYYDRFLARLDPRAVRIGIAFSVQLVEEVPADETDQRVHLVVTDAGVVDCRDE